MSQGDLVRKLKGEKADKASIDAAVKSLLQLKADFKAATGQDWKPGMSMPKASSPPAAAQPSGGNSASDINGKIVSQGDLVRKLKGEKADKASIDTAVKSLLQLKADFKAATGQDWKPGMSLPEAVSKPEPSAGVGSAADMDAKIRSQGDKVRQLKGDKADKNTIGEAVKTLLALKADFKAATGADWKPDMPVPVKSEPVKQGSGGGT